MTMNKAMSLKTKKAACAGASGRLWRVSGFAGNGDGLKSNFKGSACIRRRARAMMPKPCSIARLGLGGLKSVRRTIAAPLRGVFLLAVVRESHGVIAFAFCTGAPRGNPSGLLFPNRQSANPRGVAHHLGGCVGGFKNQLLGA